MKRADLPHGGFLSFDEYNFTDPWSEPETIVLIHGFSKNRLFWYRWLPYLAKHYRVINVDLRGHGDSVGLEAGFEMSFDPFIQDIIAFLDQLKVGRPHLAMAEFSSAIAVLIGSAYADKISSLILPGFIYNSKMQTTGYRAEWIRLAEEEGSEAWARATNSARLPADADPALKEWYVTQQARVPGWFLGKVFRFNGNNDLTDKLSQIGVPTLVLSGTEAKQASEDRTRKAIDLIPDSWGILFQGMPLNVMSACPDACALETLRFLKSSPAERDKAPRFQVIDPIQAVERNRRYM